MSRDRLPSGKDQSAPAPHRDMSIRAKHEQNRFNDSQFMQPELPGKNHKVRILFLYYFRSSSTIASAERESATGSAKNRPKTTPSTKTKTKSTSKSFI